MPEVQNFNQVHPEDRSFILGPQTFHWRPMWWRDFGEMIDHAVEEAEKDAREAKAAEAAGEEAPRDTLVKSYQELIEAISKYLEPSEVESFSALINDPEARISHLQLNELRDWLREVSNNRPTQQPLPSDVGRGSAAPTLQAV